MHDYTSFNDFAKKLKVLAHPVRLCIVAGLLGQECNVTHMQECLQLAQPTISQHLALLKKAGIIEAERRGTEMIYRVVNEQVKTIIINYLQSEGEQK